MVAQLGHHLDTDFGMVFIKAMAKVVRGLCRCWLAMLPNYLRLYITEQAPVRVVRNVKGLDLTYICSCRGEFYSRSLESKKEPETLWWIDKVVDAGVFIDVGACVGTYGMYAALRHRELSCIGVEPSFLSFDSLCKNVNANNLGNRYLAVHAVLGDSCQISTIQHSAMIPGSSMHKVVNDGERFGGIKRDVNFRVKKLTPSQLLENSGIEGKKIFIKVDVDGMEVDILKGFIRSDYWALIESVCVEVIPENEREIANMISKAGLFRIDIPLSRITSNNGHNIFFKRGGK